MRIMFNLPMRADPLNVRLRKHPMQQHRDKAKEREAVSLLMPRVMLRPVLRVTLVRFGPKELDLEDNLPGALKAFRDAVASVLKVDDASPLVDWQYGQQKAPGYAVRVIVEAIGQLPPDTRPEPKAWQLPPTLYTPPAPRPRPAPAQAKRPAPRDLRALATPATYPPKGGR